jgi:hypothetical protein
MSDMDSMDEATIVPSTLRAFEVQCIYVPRWQSENRTAVTRRGLDLRLLVPIEVNARCRGFFWRMDSKSLKNRWIWSGAP